MMKEPDEPQGRALTKEEQMIVDFLDDAIATANYRADHAARGRKYGTAHDLLARALTLGAVRAAIIGGHHDKDHPTLIINPKAQAELLALGLIGG